MTTPEYSSIQLLRNALAERGYTYECLVLNGKNYTRFIGPNGNSWLTSNTNMHYPFVSATSSKVASEKDLACELARSVGANCPRTWRYHKDDHPTSQEIKSIFSEHKDVIVKPVNSSLSKGLTLNVKTEEELSDALTEAWRFSDVALVQQQVSGEEIRFTVIDGRIECALLRRTPRVCGDGEKTVAQLVELENQARKKIVSQYVTYPLLEKPLISFKGIDLEMVPEKGEIVELGRGTMIKSGASIYNILEEVHPTYLETVSTLASQLGKGFMVVDIMIDDFRVPQSAHNYAFIEFNTAPVLKLFYSCRDGKNFDIISSLVPFIDRRISEQI